jgi:GT2 family glycosyltransferase
MWGGGAAPAIALAHDQRPHRAEDMARHICCGAMPLPSVTIVFLVHNRRDQLRTSLIAMTEGSDYPASLVDVIVVDNASDDGSAEMVEREFPGVRVVRRRSNCGVSGWNDGFRLARGDWVLALDDDCHLLPDGLGRAVGAGQEHSADLVSFKVISTEDPGVIFTDNYRTGLFAFWGCAVLMRRAVVEELGGYDPEIFVWANELEFMLRFFDHGFRHLYLPEVVAQHMKGGGDPDNWIEERSYRINARHFAYIAGKHLRTQDAAAAFSSLLARNVRDGLRTERAALKAVVDTTEGFLQGLRRRSPVQNARVSAAYRRDFETFAGPWRLSRPVPELLRGLPTLFRRGAGTVDGEPPPGRREKYFADRAALYPDETATLSF